MRSGQHKHKVILLRRVEVQSQSEVTFEYVPFAEPWARIRHLSGREYFMAAQVQAEATVEISIRWRSDVDETCRVRHVTDRSVSPPLFDEYDIKAPPMPDTKTGRRELILMCAKRSAGGWRG